MGSAVQEVDGEVGPHVLVAKRLGEAGHRMRPSALKTSRIGSRGHEREVRAQRGAVRDTFLGPDDGLGEDASGLARGVARGIPRAQAERLARRGVTERREDPDPRLADAAGPNERGNVARAVGQVAARRVPLGLPQLFVHAEEDTRMFGRPRPARRASIPS